MFSWEKNLPIQNFFSPEMIFFYGNSNFKRLWTKIEKNIIKFKSGSKVKFSSVDTLFWNENRVKNNLYQSNSNTVCL